MLDISQYTLCVSIVIACRAILQSGDIILELVTNTCFYLGPFHGNPIIRSNEEDNPHFPLERNLPQLERDPTARVSEYSQNHRWISSRQRFDYRLATNRTIMPLFRTPSPPRPTAQVPLTRASQYNEEAAPRSTMFTNHSPERLRAESVTGSYFNDSRGALVTQPPPRSRGGLFRRHSSDSVPSNRRISPAPHPPSRGHGCSTLAHQPTAGHTAGGRTIVRRHRGQMHDKSLLAALEKVRLAEMAEHGADQ